ncbi:hypothetical protein H5407_06400 [Mitsuaria sp. WAJ17]|uniref:hypothetical protein n=1 Tax=Mitsuaria sp. WAJ17 TaxID=2761452 RepID=UPI0016016135|nr:hypothetical protein [Mitsuaria sp. WAJ17]MBB2484856.1 hypothetical protein [Mitsuaria sp. WAJ17]
MRSLPAPTGSCWPTAVGWLVVSALALAAPSRAQAQASSQLMPHGSTAEAPGLRWQARVQLSQVDGLDTSTGRSSRSLSAALLGDYYLTRSGLGEGVRGGLRATGGLMMGSLSVTQSGSGLTLSAQSMSLGQSLAVGLRAVGSTGDRSDSGGTLPYIGIGYSGISTRGGWGFSADLGLINRNSLRLGNSLGSVDEALRDNRLMPVLQFGLSYSY